MTHFKVQGLMKRERKNRESIIVFQYLSEECMSFYIGQQGINLQCRFASN